MPKFIKTWCLLLLLLTIFTFTAVDNGHTEVINFIVARIYDNVITKRDHIITKRDLEIEFFIQKIIYGEESVTKKAVLDEMIDTYLVLLEIQKVSRKVLLEKSRKRIKLEQKEFESLFTDDEYNNFLLRFEISNEDIYLRFKNKVLVEDYLRRKAKIKKNGSNIDKSMILNSDIKKLLSDYASDHIKKLRMEASKIMINDFTD